MKKIIIGILTSLMVLTFCGCADRIEREQRTDSESKHEMVVVDEMWGCKILKHKKTGVHYICVKYGEGIAIEVMLNPDGTPYTGE